MFKNPLHFTFCSDITLKQNEVEKQKGRMKDHQELDFFNYDRAGETDLLIKFPVGACIFRS